MKKVDGFWHFDFPGCNGRRYTPLIGRAPVVLNPVLDVYAKTRDEIEARTGTKCDSFFLNTVGSKWRPDDFCSMLSRVACRVIGHRINVIQSSTIILDSLRADKWTEPDIALVFGVEQSIIDRRSKREQERRRDVELGERRDEHRALNQ